MFLPYIVRFGTAKYSSFNHVLVLLTESSYPLGLAAYFPAK